MADLPWVQEISADAVKHFAWGIGDNNPLWLTPKHGDATAPPCILYAIHETTVAPGMAQFRRIYKEVEWTWFQKIYLNETVSAETDLLETTNIGKNCLQIGQVKYLSSTEEVIAEAKVVCERTKDNSPIEKNYKYSEDELQNIERNILAENRIGDVARLWQNVKIEETIGMLTKGPLSIMDIVAWSAGTTGVPKLDRNMSEGGLLDETTCGPQITSWIAQLATDWIGDQGFLHRLNVKMSKQPGLGSTTLIKGCVTDKRKIDEHFFAELSILAEDFSGKKIAEAKALVILPSLNEKVLLPLTSRFSFNTLS